MVTPYELGTAGEEDSGRSAWERIQSTATMVGRAAMGGLVALEIAPITNEGLRAAAFVTTQLVTENPHLAAGAFTAATFAIEAGGAFATAKLLHDVEKTNTSGIVKQSFDKVAGWVTKRSSKVSTNIAVESGISLITGSPAVLIAKHLQDPTRTYAQDQRYGLGMSAFITAVTGTEAYLLADGISSPSPATIGLATVAIGAVIGGANYLKHKFTCPAEIIEGEA